MSLYLGIDTSNYTTSVAVCGDKTVNLRKIIDVKKGQRGIRQSDGVFLHTKELPNLFERLDIDFKDIKAVGVSAKPRNQENSYMPVFTVGESVGTIVAKALDVPLFKTSHQDGHIMAGLVSCGQENLLDKEFTAVHLSGGTTEILSCKYENGSFNPKIVGGTKDISAGQLIDRLGVKLGMKFPCGQELDKLSLTADGEIDLKISVNGGYMNFSGIETKLLNMVGSENASILARSLLVFIGKSIKKALSCLNPKDVLFVGGVASNTILRQALKDGEYNAYFAENTLSCDNAVGVAHIAKRMYEEMK
ncbi:MAG: hypothetical protein IJR79_01775 [Clostridia bacterium]|nr:hypothetical protein [Clostridia bacterium]MBQ7751680.1 hypothetical protein [Clostridia bacterium]